MYEWVAEQLKMKDKSVKEGSGVTQSQEKKNSVWGNNQKMQKLLLRKIGCIKEIVHYIDYVAANPREEK